MINQIKIILVYHGIGDSSKFLEVSEDSFKKQINYLLGSGFSFLCLEDLLKDNIKSVTLVFDDGLTSVLKVKDFLEDKKIPFALSLISEELKSDSGKYLKVPDLLEFKNCQFYSHSRSHLDLTELSGNKLKEEIVLSKADLEKRLKKEISTFVYPFGKCNQEIIRCVKKSGYKNALGLFPFHLSNKPNLFCLPRINVNGFIYFNKFKFLVSKPGNLYLHLAFAKRLVLGQDYLK